MLPERLASALAQLSEPPAGRTGWPWTEECARLPDTMSDGFAWPRITIVTPSFNQADYLEETLRSVLLQGYPNLEYIVIDGGSSDQSLSILERYSPWLEYWISEPDRGQSHAINKGFAKSTGEILAWLNSDDIYYPEALRRAGEALAGRERSIFAGAMDKVQVTGAGTPPRLIRTSSPQAGPPLHEFPLLRNEQRGDFHFIQPPMFWTRDLWTRTGGLDERYHYVMDMEWCNRALAAGGEVTTSDAVLSRFSLHDGSKSQEEMHRMRWEEAVMYWRLGRTEDFRLLPCLLSALLPIQRTLSLGGAMARRNGRPIRQNVLAGAARAVKLLRLGVTRFCGTQRNGGGSHE